MNLSDATAGQHLGLEMANRIARTPGKTAVLAGAAGTGKTSLLSLIASDIGNHQIATPTGRAALRVREATGFPASTLHQLLYNPVLDTVRQEVTFKLKPPGNLLAKLVIVDEASMITPEMDRDLHMVAGKNTSILYVGDDFQLPPIQPKGAPPFSVLAPDFDCTERVELTEILRQAADNPIIAASMALRTGDQTLSGLKIVNSSDDFASQEMMRVHMSGGAIICHTNNMRWDLNRAIRGLLGYAEPLDLDEPLLIRKNNHQVELYNGEIIKFPGWAVEPTQRQIEDYRTGAKTYAHFGAVEIRGQQVTMCLEEITGECQANTMAISMAAKQWAKSRSLMMALPEYGGKQIPITHLHANYGYALTTHAAQGSEFDSVVFVMEPSVRLWNEDGRRLAYTAITRASKNVLVVRT